MYADNAYIALYDDQRQAINFPYWVDLVDLDVPDPNLWEPMGSGQATGTTAYVLRTGKPALIDAKRHHELVASGEIKTLGVVGEGDWLGAPLVAEGRTLGVIVVQTYTADQLHTEADRDLLAFVGQHVGTALSRVRAIEETRQRNAELALVNEIGLALGKQLDFAAIIELVGERVRAIFAVESLFIALYDAETEPIRFPYDIDEGDALRSGRVPARTGDHLDRHPDGPPAPPRDDRGTGRRGRPARSVGPRRSRGSACRSAPASGSSASSASRASSPMPSARPMSGS